MTAAIPIVMLPGLDGTGDLLAPLAAHLLATRPVTVVSHPANEPLGYDALTALVTERLPPGRFIILGESFSGPIAIEIAAREKARAVGLILAASFARSPLPRMFRHFAWAASPRLLPSALVEAALLDRCAPPELRAALSAALAKVPDDVIRSRVREVLRADKRERLGETRCPMLYLAAARDRLIGRGSLAVILAQRADCQVRRLDAPHMLLETCCGEAAEAIGRFCDGLTG